MSDNTNNNTNDSFTNGLFDTVQANDPLNNFEANPPPQTPDSESYMPHFQPDGELFPSRNNIRYWEPELNQYVEEPDDMFTVNANGRVVIMLAPNIELLTSIVLGPNGEVPTRAAASAVREEELELVAEGETLTVTNGEIVEPKQNAETLTNGELPEQNGQNEKPLSLASGLDDVVFEDEKETELVPYNEGDENENVKHEGFW